jgi:probable rRNA maturation factor
MLTFLQIEQSELSILLTGDNQIHILNRQYRKKDRPTDVLAFAMREGSHSEFAGEILGDVVISLETAARQAKEHDRAPLEEVTFLLAHGLLHLLGWDHDTEAKDKAMRRETERLCRAAVAPVAPAAARPRNRKGGQNTGSKRRTAPSRKR